VVQTAAAVRTEKRVAESCETPSTWRAASIDRVAHDLSEADMKKLVEILLCILHPVAVVLIWINLVFRTDIGLVAKLTWAIASIVPFVPFVYVLTGNDFI
jgi:predicted neuraminidase